MNKQVTIALVVAPPGPLMDSLQALLRTLPDIEIVAEARSLTALMGSGNTLRPELMLIGLSKENGCELSHLAQVVTLWSGTAVIVFVETDSQRKAALAAGADVVLFSGCRAQQIIEQIELILAK